MTLSVLEIARTNMKVRRSAPVLPVQAAEIAQPRDAAERIARTVVQAITRTVREELERFRVELIRQLDAKGWATDAVSRVLAATQEAVARLERPVALDARGVHSMSTSRHDPRPAAGSHLTENADALLRLVREAGDLDAFAARGAATPRPPEVTAADPADTDAVLEAAAAVAVPAPPSPGRVREMPAAAAEIQAQEDAAAADGPGAPDDLPGPTVEGETPLPMQDPSPTLDATAAPVPTYAETTESETCSAVQEGGMPLPAAVTPEDAWLPSEAQAEDDPVAALSRAPGDVHPDVLPVSEHPSGALDVEPEDDADDLPEADPHFRLMPTPDSEAAEGQKTAAPPYPAEAPGLHRLVDQACEEMRAVARAVKAELSVLPIKVAKVLAEQVKDSSHQRHIEAINVSLASLNDAMGAIREYDFAPAMQQAVPKLWPGFNLPAEITEIKKRLSSLERVLQEERAG